MYRSTFIVAALAFMAVSHSPQAHEYRHGSLFIDHPWTRPTPGASKLGAAYLTIRNNGPEADTLTGAKTEAAGKVEIHEHSHDAGGVMRMREVQGGLNISAGATVEMKPGGIHFMLMDLNYKLQEGKTAPLTLNFAKAGDVKVDLKIENMPAPAGKADAGAHSHHKH